MPKNKAPRTYRPSGKNIPERAPYEPELPLPRPGETKRKLVDDRTSCRKVIGNVFGQPKHCPIKPLPGSEYCEDHQGEEKSSKKNK